LPTEREQREETTLLITLFADIDIVSFKVIGKRIYDE